MIIWNPWHDCHKVSEGCAHCYMYFLDSKQAFLSGLSYQGRKVPRILRMSGGTLFGTDVITPEPFFREHCNTCGSRMTCNGCSNCGACDKNKSVQQVEIQV